MTPEEMEKKIKELEKKVEELSNRRIGQQQILPDSIKMRAVGEGVRFIRGGATANKPTTGEEPMQGIAIFYDTTTKKLYCWNPVNEAWEYAQFS